ncbi:MAG: ferritin-like domain-containing protein [Polyangiaceae bacterium]
MTFRLRRGSVDGAVSAGEGHADLDLASEHAAIVAPRRGEIDWGGFDRAAYAGDVLAKAAAEWRERARQEYASLALFTRLASQVHLLGAPLDWSGAFARMIADEVRHTEICARFAELLEPGVPVEIDETELHLPVVESSLLAHVRGTVLAAFCIGETLSGRFFRRCLRVATVPLARDVVRTIVDDETFHGKVGWELLALLFRGDGDPGFARERAAIAAGLEELFTHYRALCGAQPGEAWAARGPEAPSDPNFGTLTPAGYARSFFEGMRDDVVPALVALGLPEAEEAWRVARTPPPRSPAPLAGTGGA